MDGGIGEVKQLGPGPKTRVCYICGRQYGLHSYEIHLKQCKELWIAREALKDPKDRKKLPEDPLAGRDPNEVTSPQKSKKQNGDSGSASSGVGSSAGGAMDLEEMNRIASEAFNNVALSTCAYCGRTFLPEKLVIHNKSCTADKPARRVDQSVRKGLATPQVTEPSQRPSTSHQKAAKEYSDYSEVSSPREPSTLAGPIGGSAGRSIRSKASRTQNSTADTIGSLNAISKPTDPGQKKEIIEYLQKKIAAMEIIIGDLNNSLVDMKDSLNMLIEE